MTKEVEAYKDTIDSLMQLNEDEVLEWFFDLTDDVIIGKNAEFVYLPGKRAASNRVLIVAHADTVWNDDKPRQVDWLGHICKSNWFSNDGIGADDRVGCAAAWLVATQGEHSVLITTGEEIGGIGAHAALAEIAPLLKEHAFMLQVDRAGDEELVFYPGGHCKEWAKWLSDNDFAGFSQGWGSFTDITILSNGLKLCAANLAAGYINEHTKSETFFLDAWMRTYDRLERLLARESLPKFKPDGRFSFGPSWMPRRQANMVIDKHGGNGRDWWKEGEHQPMDAPSNDDCPWGETEDSDFCTDCGKVLMMLDSIMDGRCVVCRQKVEERERELWPEEMETEDGILMD
mgnify:FL=1